MTSPDSIMSLWHDMMTMAKWKENVTTWCCDTKWCHQLHSYIKWQQSNQNQQKLHAHFSANLGVLHQIYLSECYQIYQQSWCRGAASYCIILKRNKITGIHMICMSRCATTALSGTIIILTGSCACTILIGSLFSLIGMYHHIAYIFIDISIYHTSISTVTVTLCSSN